MNCVDLQVGAIVVLLLAIRQGAVADDMADETAVEAEVGEALEEDGDNYFFVRDFIDEGDPLLEGLVGGKKNSSSDEFAANITPEIVINGNEGAKLTSEVPCQLLGQEVEGDVLEMRPDGHRSEGHRHWVLTVLQRLNQDRILEVSPRAAAGDVVEVSFLREFEDEARVAEGVSVDDAPDLPDMLQVVDELLGCDGDHREEDAHSQAASTHGAPSLGHVDDDGFLFLPQFLVHAWAASLSAIGERM